MQAGMKKVSILIPCYNESESLEALYVALRELMDAQSDYQWEVLMVNDGSKDTTLDIIKQLRSRDPSVISTSPVILGRRTPCWRVSTMPLATVWSSWTPTSNIRLTSSPTC